MCNNVMWFTVLAFNTFTSQSKHEVSHLFMSPEGAPDPEQSWKQLVESGHCVWALTCKNHLAHLALNPFVYSDQVKGGR
jgi:hypothetical protein